MNSTEINRVRLVIPSQIKRDGHTQHADKQDGDDHAVIPCIMPKTLSKGHMQWVANKGAREVAGVVRYALCTKTPSGELGMNMRAH
jgi:hypothetical protein